MPPDRGSVGATFGLISSGVLYQLELWRNYCGASPSVLMACTMAKIPPRLLEINLPGSTDTTFYTCRPLPELYPLPLCQAASDALCTIAKLI